MSVSILFAVLGLALVGAGAGAWVAYFRWKDKVHPEPGWIIALALLGGSTAVLAAFAGFEVLDLIGLEAAWMDLESGELVSTLRTTLAIGLVEEGAKLLPVAIIARLSSHFDELIDGFVYAGAAAAGFALLETIVLFGTGALGSPWELAGRAAAAPITHALFAAPWGLGIAYWALERRRWPLVLGFVVSALAHGCYDLCLAREPLRLGGPLIVLLLWIWMLRTVLVLEKRGPV